MAKFYEERIKCLYAEKEYWRERYGMVMELVEKMNDIIYKILPYKLYCIEDETRKKMDELKVDYYPEKEYGKK